MMTPPEDPQDSPKLTALTELYGDSMGGPSEAELDRGLDSFLARAASGNIRPPRRWFRPSMVALAAVVSILLAMQVTSLIRRHWSAPPLPMLAYEIDGGSVLEGGYLRESGHTGMKVRFNEGSRFDLTPGTRGQIREVDRTGARVSIEHGTASFQVTHGTGRRWMVDAGPFQITVKGTIFTVSWDPVSEKFELRLQQGRVLVSGPVSAGEMTLRTGQRLVVNLAKAQAVITEEDPGPSHGDSVGALPSALPAPHVSALVPPTSVESDRPDQSGPSAAAVRKTRGERRWSEELARGRWDRILADAEQFGIDEILSRAPSEDLFALADAARYSRRPDLARAALLAARRRFPHSARALDALFLLGRVEESRERGAAQAIVWYDEYLGRAPNGPFAGEALGRKMTLTDKLEGSARARPLAEEYLRRFPKGIYSGSARTLLGVQ